MKKPCIECGNECEIFPIMLGDTFTLTYLRVCGAECMFSITYDYLYEIGHHKSFRNSLYDKQNEEDKKWRDEFIGVTTEVFLSDFKKHLVENPNMLSVPVPEGVLKMFESIPQIPSVSSTPCRFIRPTKEEKLVWQKQHVSRLESELDEAMKDLEVMENE